MADKIRKTIELNTFTHEKGDFSVTSSFGVTQVRTDDPSAEDIIERADTALYQAKHRGKNCVVVAGDIPTYYPFPLGPLGDDKVA